MVFDLELDDYFVCFVIILSKSEGRKFDISKDRIAVLSYFNGIVS